MSKKLVIVESPAKSRTLKKFLGADYEVVACGGHVRDLPSEKLAVDIDNGFAPQYVNIPGKGKIIALLKRAAKNADVVFLASDPDREGEAIAWHISQLIGKDEGSIKRVLFNQITKQAVLTGIAHPSKIDIRKVDSQQARRILDRLVGYKVSPFLWKMLYKGLSAGRVQTVALRLICERENDIDAFVPKEYWHLTANLSHGKDAFSAKATKFKGEPLDITTEKEALEHKTSLEKLAYSVTNKEIKKVEKKPPPPFITSSMQLAAARKLKFGANRTMRIAQTLYEGIELGKGEASGLITYMRTDSVRVADEAIAAAAEYIEREFGKRYARPRRYKSGKMSQDAHEAIRPTDASRTPESVKESLTPEQFRLYNLIWRRFLSSMMSSAEYRQTKITVGAGDYELSASASALVFDGFMRIYTERTEDDIENANALPELETGDKLKLIEIDPSQHFTKPPARFTEGTLIRELERNGVGRPSTYAQIITTLTRRKYIARQKGRLTPTDLGKQVFELLIRLFKGLFDVSFTAEMEGKLDLVEEDKLDWVALLSDFYGGFKKMLENADKKWENIKKNLEEKTEYKCEKCGSPMVIKWGRYGRFLACTNFPECKNTRPIDDKGKPAEEEKIDKKCPKCGKQLVVKHDRRGRRFLACSGYPKCKYTESYDTGYTCPNEGCDGHVQEKYTRKGRVFYGCSNYPKCDFASWDPPTDGQCPDCGCPTIFLSVRKTGTTKKCVRCGHTEKVEES